MWNLRLQLTGTPTAACRHTFGISAPMPKTISYLFSPSLPSSQALKNKRQHYWPDGAMTPIPKAHRLLFFLSLSLFDAARIACIPDYQCREPSAVQLRAVHAAIHACHRLAVSVQTKENRRNTASKNKTKPRDPSVPFGSQFQFRQRKKTKRKPKSACLAGASAGVYTIAFQLVCRCHLTPTAYYEY